MGRQRKNKAMITVAVAAVLLAALLAAGTLLRMNTRDMGFGQAFRSFVCDTFNAGA